MKAFPLRSETRQGCPLSSHLINMVLNYLIREIRRKEIKDTKIRKETVKISLFAKDMMFAVHGKTQILHKRAVRTDKPFLYNSSCKIAS